MSTPEPEGAGLEPASGSPQPPAVVLTLGKFDGVHAGHRYLLAQVIEEAGRRGVQSAALVLHPDPAAVVAGRPVGLLTTLADRCRRIRAFGVDIAEPLHFTARVAGLSPTAFLDRVTERFQLVAMVVGPDFGFGHQRRGTIETLRQLGRQRGFEVVVVPALEHGGQKISSRHVRARLAAGDIPTARSLLRAPPRLVGVVVHGAARGRALGFPTANLDPIEDFVIPANGIYTVRTRWRRRPASQAASANGVASIGVRPTFDHGARVIEVHLLDFAGDLYGCEMRVDFLNRQRDELRFDTPEDLVHQMQIDVANARATLAAEDAAPWHIATTDSGPVVLARGIDLAALCEHAANGLLAAAGLQPVCSPAAGRPHRVTLSAGSDRLLLEQWLALAASSLSGRATPFGRATVFYASAGTLHGLLFGSRPDPPSPLSAVQLEDFTRRPDGWLEATISCHQ